MATSRIKDRPILCHGIPIVGRMPLFTADMRQAIRDNLKTQTRQAIKEYRPTWRFVGLKDDLGYPASRKYVWAGFLLGPNSESAGYFKYPYGKPGEARCMCEPLKRGRDGLAPGGLAYYRDDRELVISLITGKPIPWRWKRDYLSSIHMPTEAARTICRITDIRVEKLQEISEEDAIAEGVGHGFQMNAGWPDYQHIGDDGICTLTQDDAWTSFATLWDSIYAKPQPIREKGKIIAYESFPWSEETRNLRKTINSKPHYCYPNPQVWVNAFEKLEI